MNWKSILLVAVCTITMSVAQLFYKFGAENLPNIFFNFPLIAGLALYGISAVFFIAALKFGDVTFVYPMFATSYIWVSMLSWHFFGDNIGFFRISGIVLIFAGVTSISFSGVRKKKVKNNG